MVMKNLVWVETGMGGRSMINPPRLHTYRTPKQHMVGRLSRMLAKHNIKSVALPPRKYSTTFHQLRMHWDYVHRAFTASLVNAAGFILDKAVDPSNSESKSIIDI